MIDHKYIPLLSKRSIHEMNPQEFKSHVKGLYWKPEIKRKTVVKKKVEFSFRLTKIGSLSIRATRPLLPTEIELIATGSGKSITDVLDYIKKTKGRVLLAEVIDAPENNSQTQLFI